MEVVLMSNDELIEEDKRAIKQRPTTLKYQCYLNENKDGMRYISLGLGRSDYRPQEWTIGVGLLKEMDLNDGPSPSLGTDQVHPQQPPAYKEVYKLQGFGDGPSPSLGMTLSAGELDG
jgi:hypothetical protein